MRILSNLNDNLNLELREFLPSELRTKHTEAMEVSETLHHLSITVSVRFAAIGIRIFPDLIIINTRQAHTCSHQYHGTTNAARPRTSCCVYIGLARPYSRNSTQITRKEQPNHEPETGMEWSGNLQEVTLRR